MVTRFGSTSIRNNYGCATLCGVDMVTEKGAAKVFSFVILALKLYQTIEKIDNIYPLLNCDSHKLFIIYSVPNTVTQTFFFDLGCHLFSMIHMSCFKLLFSFSSTHFSTVPLVLQWNRPLFRIGSYCCVPFIINCNLREDVLRFLQKR